MEGTLFFASFVFCCCMALIGMGMYNVFSERKEEKEIAPFCEKIHEQIDASSDLNGNPFVIQGELVHKISRSKKNKSMFLNELTKVSYMEEGADFIIIDGEKWFTHESLRGVKRKRQYNYLLGCLKNTKY